MLCDFYGRVFAPPRTVEHTRGICNWRRLWCRRHVSNTNSPITSWRWKWPKRITDPVQRAFRRAGHETRLVHPLASAHYRRTVHADTKSDAHDLEAIFRAAVNGFGLLAPRWDEEYRRRQDNQMVDKPVVPSRRPSQHPAHPLAAAPWGW